MLPQLNYPSVIPDDLVPSRDTDAIVPLGRFTPEMIGGVSRTLAKMIPWGQSPLYLAMIEAFKDFGADDNSTTKSIVVITDGDNFQFNLSGRPGGDGGNPTSIDDVMRAWESAKIPLFILGVGISDSETPNARKTLQSLAQRTQGKYYDIENGSDLLRALLEQLATADYQVKLDSSADLQLPSPPVESKLNSQVEIKNIALATSRYQVLFQSISKPIQLAGGESLEMFVREDGRRCSRTARAGPGR